MAGLRTAIGPAVSNTIGLQASSKSFQVQAEARLCIWTLSFHQELRVQGFRAQGLVEELKRIAACSSSPEDKHMNLIVVPYNFASKKLLKESVWV